MIYIYKTKSFNPYYNLALENFFFNFPEKNSFFIYFWQNENTVVIGRNQEAEAECNIYEMKRNNTHLLRRETGGGAVYHDKNNLNFSFVVPKDIYNKGKSMNIIKNALNSLGFNPEISGRNDILVDGKKVSGNAYYNGKYKVLHHGTILINTDFKKMEEILTPDISKLESKGVKSVKSRVLNLKEVKNISVKELENSIIKEFLKCYEGQFKTFKIKEYKKQITKQKNFYKSKKWLSTEEFKFASTVYKKKLKCGLVTIKQNKKGEYKIFSDALDLAKIKDAQNVLNGQQGCCPSTSVIKSVLSVID